MRRLLLAFCLVQVLGACQSIPFQIADPTLSKKYSKEQLRILMISSGHLGCPVDDIQVTDYLELGLISESWTAVCHGEKFYCSYTNTDIACTQARSAKQ